jgi:hypothetical protein
MLAGLQSRKEQPMGDAPEMPKLTLDDFSPHLGKDFTVRGRGGSASITLVSADAVKVGDPATIWTPPADQKLIPLPDNLAKVVASTPGDIRPGGPFSLYFAATGATVLGEGTYTVDHPTLGKVDVFLSPATKDGKRGYSAAFS